MAAMAGDDRAEDPADPNDCESRADTLMHETEGMTRRYGQARLETPPVGEALMEEIRKPSWARLRSDGRISAGGMGAIEAVVDGVLQRRLARKLIHPDLQERDATLKMFVREAQITGRLSHPNIVPVHEIGYDLTGRLYFTMKLIRGQTLSQLIDARESVELGRDDLFTLLEAIVKVCDALSFAHSNGVLHCDIKPDNIMIGDFGEVYLMDWGVAHIMDPQMESSNWVGQTDVAGLILGTAQYMSPEQASSPRDELDPRSDLFSLGAALYEVLTKRPPHPAGNPLVSLMSAQTGEIPSISEAIGHGKVPPALERIVMRALAADREQRYPSVEAFQSDLVHFIRGDGEFPRVVVPDKELIIREGEIGDAAYIIVNGKCEVYQTRDGEHVTLRMMGPGEFFGEAAILTDSPRTASVAAVGVTTLMVISREVLDTELGLVKPWLATLLRTLAERFRDIDRKLREATSESS